MRDCLSLPSIWNNGIQFLRQYWPSLDEWDKLLKLAAVLVGGSWVLMNYLRGRTFKSRLEFSVTGGLRKVGDKLHVTTTVVAKNVGLSKVILEQMGSGVTYGFYHEDSSSPEGISLRELGITSRIFTEHEWIEPGEPISTEVFVILPVNDSANALKVDITQLGRSQFFSRKAPTPAKTPEEAARKNTQWSASMVLPIVDEPEPEVKVPILKQIIDLFRGEKAHE